MTMKQYTQRLYNKWHLRAQALELHLLGSIPVSTIFWLCDFRQVT